MVALVLLPGLDGTGLLFEDFVREIEGSLETTIIPYPTDRFMGYPELEQWVRVLLPAAQPFFLLGESFSGPIALSIAASPPPNMRGVILSCSFARKPLLISSLWARLLPKVAIKKVPIQLLEFLLMGRFASDKGRQLLDKALANVELAVLKSRAVAALCVDKSEELSRIKIPFLYLRASEDRIIDRRSFVEIKRLLPSTKLVEIEAPHFLLQLLPELAAAAICDFVSAQTTKAQ